MYDKEFIQRVCDLSCSKKDMARDLEAIRYDTENPFKKYYSLSTIKGAIEKYASRAWDARTLANWANRYNWILSGGCSDAVTDDLTAFERFFRNVLTWDLDGLSFFSGEEEDGVDVHAMGKLFEDYDHIWQTRDAWGAVYAMIGPYAKVNEDQYVVLVNHQEKEYMIIHSDFLENGYEDEYFRFVSQEEHIGFVEQLKRDGYTLLSCAEEEYDTEIKTEA